mmetsp:Transcript_5687/g.8331  ORF Transcript_5687/g.8331 Transcript_5687/m.8331 type:complete len:154 (-) Transcript_5687:93-554(-)
MRSTYMPQCYPLYRTYTKAVPTKYTITVTTVPGLALSHLHSSLPFCCSAIPRHSIIAAICSILQCPNGSLIMIQRWMGHNVVELLAVPLLDAGCCFFNSKCRNNTSTKLQVYRLHSNLLCSPLLALVLERCIQNTCIKLSSVRNCRVKEKGRR